MVPFEELQGPPARQAFGIELQQGLEPPRAAVASLGQILDVWPSRLDQLRAEHDPGPRGLDANAPALRRQLSGEQAQERGLARAVLSDRAGPAFGQVQVQLVEMDYRKIKVTFRVKSDGSPEILDECARFSPVFDVVAHGTEVVLNVEKTGEPHADGPVQTTGIEKTVVSPS